jgi:TolB protein
MMPTRTLSSHSLAAVAAAFALGTAAGCAGTDPAGRPAGGQAGAEAAGAASAAVVMAPDTSEPRLGRLLRLTDGGANAEAYFSADGRRVIYQATVPGESECDQIYTINVDGTDRRLVSTGAGRTTCGYFFPSGDRIIYSSTHHLDAACPPRPDRSQGYVWGLFAYDIFAAGADGSDPVRLTDNDGYDAEATISPDGRTIVFTSHRDGDLDIYAMDTDGGNVRRLTHEPGYDGGPFFSPDGTRIVYRAHHPTDPAELAAYRALLGRRLIRPDRVEIFVMDADGSNKRQLTNNGAANFAPFFHPSGRQIIFSSNMHDPRGRSFNLYLLDIESGAIERVTRSDGFDSFPMFNRDGTQLIFASSRGTTEPGRYDIFIADWQQRR